MSFSGTLRNDLRGFYRIKTENQPRGAATMFAVSASNVLVRVIIIIISGGRRYFENIILWRTQ